MIERRTINISADPCVSELGQGNWGKQPKVIDVKPMAFPSNLGVDDCAMTGSDAHHLFVIGLHVHLRNQDQKGLSWRRADSSTDNRANSTFGPEVGLHLQLSLQTSTVLCISGAL